MIENKIFIQIAAYRDPELLPTLKDCINKAKYPQNLRFSIAWQHAVEDTWDNLDEFINDDRFSVINIDYKDSLGACWARNALQQLYNGEEYTLQLDSHHRFIQNWDEECINMIKDLQLLGYKKPLLTCYLPSYNPSNDPSDRVNIPWKLDFDRFTPEGVVFFMPSIINDFKKLNHPIPARFYSAHFCFTLGSFVTDVPHDPEYYFHGEEISISVRAFTKGYDLFHPHKVIAWHEYTRVGRTKHWDDNSEWGKMNLHSLERNRKLLGVDNILNNIDFGIFGLGDERSIEDYVKYAGVSFKHRAVSRATLNKEIAHSLNESRYINDMEFIKRFKHCIDISFDSIDDKDYDNWIIFIYNQDRGIIFYRNIDINEIKRLKNPNEGCIKIWVEFDIKEGEGTPKSWELCMYQHQSEQINKIDGNI